MMIRITSVRELDSNLKKYNMDHISFDKLLLKTAFCCMASDGHIDIREISIIKSMCELNPLFEDFNFQNEINHLVVQINSKGKEFIQHYFDLLKQSVLTEEEELALIHFAIQTIKADEQVQYSEVKFFKNIRHRLKITDDKILAIYPDIELFLEEDLVTGAHPDNLANQYLTTVELPQFPTIDVNIT